MEICDYVKTNDRPAGPIPGRAQAWTGLGGFTYPEYCMYCTVVREKERKTPLLNFWSVH